MTIDDLISELIEVSVKAYKKNSKGCKEWDKLNRHEPVEIDGYTFSYWREYGVYKVCQYIKEKCPTCNITANLDGNDSYIFLELNNEEEQKINRIIYNFLKTLKE